MANNILKWSKRAREDNRKLFAYLLEEWGEDIALRVRKEIEESAVRIRDFPEQFPIFLRGKQIRRYVLSKQTSILFKANNELVEKLSRFSIIAKIHRS
ncbi:type II toxin-antitoxin system RelE/ParE family toxin [Mucilaginibacter sp. HD30]